MPTVRYHEIAEDIRRRVEGGELGPGRMLPSEAELSTRYDASRMTVRRALETLRADGLVDARQGLGWFAAPDRLRQSLGRLGTIEAQLEALGVMAERRVLEFAFVPASRAVRATLEVDQVLRVRRLNLADGDPFALVTVWCPAELAADVSRADVERSPFYELIGVPLARAVQTVGAASADEEEAGLLEVAAGSPVLRCERVTRDDAGRAVLLSEHVFPAHRTEFVVELTSADQSMAPSGLRLVE